MADEDKVRGISPYDFDRLLAKAALKIMPLAKAAIFSIAQPGAEAPLLGADIGPTNSPSFLRVYICMTNAGIFRVSRTITAVTVIENLNGGLALAAGAAYMFTIPWQAGDGIDFRYSVTGGTINVLRALEIGGAE